MAETINTMMVNVVSNPVAHDAAGAATEPAKATSPECMVRIVMSFSFVWGCSDHEDH